jgi:hypothetical protein
MKLYITDAINRIAKFSNRLDDMTLLKNQNWVNVNDLTSHKEVYIFRDNGVLFIARNGIVDRNSYEYLSSGNLLINDSNRSFLFKTAFVDKNILALNLDSTNQYAFFVNETRNNESINNYDSLMSFLKKEYLKPVIDQPKLDSYRNTAYSKEKAEKLTKEQESWIKDLNKCPACGKNNVSGKDECPSCGLTLSR